MARKDGFWGRIKGWIKVHIVLPVMDTIWIILYGQRWGPPLVEGIAAPGEGNTKPVGKGRTIASRAIAAIVVIGLIAAAVVLT